MLDCDAIEMQEHDTKHNNPLELVVLIVLFLFVVIISLLALLVLQLITSAAAGASCATRCTDTLYAFVDF